jgi:hypothetical protein
VVGYERKGDDVDVTADLTDLMVVGREANMPTTAERIHEVEGRCAQQVKLITEGSEFSAALRSLRAETEAGMRSLLGAKGWKSYSQIRADVAANRIPAAGGREAMAKLRNYEAIAELRRATTQRYRDLVRSVLDNPLISHLEDAPQDVGGKGGASGKPGTGDGTGEPATPAEPATLESVYTIWRAPYWPIRVEFWDQDRTDIRAVVQADWQQNYQTGELANLTHFHLENPDNSDVLWAKIQNGARFPWRIPRSGRFVVQVDLRAVKVSSNFHLWPDALGYSSSGWDTWTASYFSEGWRGSMPRYWYLEEGGGTWDPDGTWGAEDHGWPRPALPGTLRRTQFISQGTYEKGEWIAFDTGLYDFHAAYLDDVSVDTHTESRWLLERIVAGPYLGGTAGSIDLDGQMSMQGFGGVEVK